MTVVRLALVIFIVFHEANTISTMCYSSLSCYFESTYCRFDDGSHGLNTDTWMRGLRWELQHGHKGHFVFTYNGSADHSGRTTVDLTSPPVCSGGPIQVSFEYIVNKANSQLQVLTRCGGKVTTDVHTYSHHDTHSTWKTGNVTLQPCSHGDTQVVFRGSLNVAPAIGVDTVSIVSAPSPTTRILQPISTQKPTSEPKQISSQTSKYDIITDDATIGQTALGKIGTHGLLAFSGSEYWLMNVQFPCLILTLFHA